MKHDYDKMLKAFEKKHGNLADWKGTRESYFIGLSLFLDGWQLMVGKQVKPSNKACNGRLCRPPKSSGLAQPAAVNASRCTALCKRSNYEIQSW